jgi:hypothetical protein
MSMAWFRAEKHAPEEQLSAYLDMGLGERESRRLISHVEDCERCASLLTELGSVKTLMGSLPSIQPSRSFVLGRQHDIPSLAPAPAPHRRLVLAPVLTLTILLSLLAVDFADFSGSAGEGGAASLSKASDAALSSGTPPSLPEAAAAGGNADRSQVAAPEGFAVPSAVPPDIRDNGALRAESQAAGESPAPAAAAEQDGGDSGFSLLRVLEVVAGIAFIGSLALVLWPRMGGDTRR